MERSKQPGGAFANFGQAQRDLGTSAAEINARFGGQAAVKAGLGEGTISKIGDKVGGFFGDLSGLEKAYLAAQIVPPITEAIAGDRDRWSEGGTDLFAEMYARHPQGRTPRSYSDWSRGR